MSGRVRRWPCAWQVPWSAWAGRSGVVHRNGLRVGGTCRTGSVRGTPVVSTPARRPLTLRTDLLPRDSILKTLRHHQLPDGISFRVLELAERAASTFQVVVTDFFLRPAERAALENALAKMAYVAMVSSGGYASAERHLVAFLRRDPDDDLATLQPTGLEACHAPLRVLEVRGNFTFDPADHRDFLGALLNSTGLRRERIGDILVLGDRGAQVIVLADDVTAITDTLASVRTVPVQCRTLDSLSELQVAPPRVKEVSSVEASLRIDSVASAGFACSRTKMVEMVRAGDVQLNHQPVTATSKVVKEGDLITIKGRGRVQVESVSLTSKNRYRVQMKRFL